jgi:hypothetical protein
MQFPAIFLKNRLDNLYEEASKSQGSWEASKLLCLSGSFVAGVAAVTNPLMMLFSIGASCAYAWAIVKEGSQSTRFKPFPIFTQSIGDLLNGAAGGGDEESEPISAELNYLSPQETTEVLLLDYHIQSIARFLELIDEPEREQAYKQFLKYFHHKYGAIVRGRSSLLFNSDQSLQQAFNASFLVEGKEWKDLPADDAISPEVQAANGSTALSANQPEAEPAISLTKLEPGEIVEVELAQYLFSDKLGQDLKSVLFMGESGAGKGNAIYGVSEELIRIYPNAELYAVNPKPAANESDRWRRYRSVLPVLDEESALEAFEYIEAAESEMLERQQKGRTGTPYVVVLDEFNTLLDLLSKEDRAEFMKKVKRIIRQGRSNWVWIWVGAQTGNCEDIDISAPDRANFIRIALGFQGNMDALQIAIANPAMFPGLRKSIAGSLIPSLKSRGIGIAATSFFDRIVQIPNYLSQLQEPTPKASTPPPKISQNLAVPIEAPAVSADLIDEYRDVLSPPIPEAEKEISAHLKKLKVRRTSRQGAAIFKVWKWCEQQPQSTAISLEDAWERFRKDRRGKLTKPEVRWSLHQLHTLELIDCPDVEDNDD